METVQVIDYLLLDIEGREGIKDKCSQLEVGNCMDSGRVK